MKQMILFVFLSLPAVFTHGQQAVLPSAANDSSAIRLHPNPARDNVFVTVKDFDQRFRYNLLLKDSKGRPVKNLVLLQPQQLIPLKASYGKGVLWVEVWKEKELLGRQRLMIVRH
ncbi:MAG TPA: hypothetical protein PKE63_02485 [Lacibacter sp.]|nr:hypothetical protein [Lacibacter sp.]HMO88587.1 hypothetical protein [Lacibacter sp.]HMP86113.1 hypothetical protein [Lacibacter sp.]